MRQMYFLLVFATSLFFASDSVASKESGADFGGFYPQNLESLDGGGLALGRRRNGLSLLEILADYFPSGSGERNFGDPAQRRLQPANAPERPFWNRLFAKDIKDSPVDAQDSNLDRRKRYCCSLDMYCFLCYR